MSALITIFNAKPHLQAVMKAYMRVLKNLHDIVFQYLINLPQPHHIFFTFQYAQEDCYHFVLGSIFWAVSVSALVVKTDGGCSGNRGRA